MMRDRTIAAIRDAALEAEVEALYSARLPYHNFAHAVQTLGAADRILGDCDAEGIAVDREVVYFALLFHDAGYQTPHEPLGFHNKEAYSAHLAHRHFAARGLGLHQLRAVEQAIMATVREAACVTPEDAVVRMADLAGISAGYDVFLHNTVNLWDEVHLLHGVRLPWREWCTRTREILIGYLDQGVTLTREFDRRAPDGFVARGYANIERLGAEPEPAR